MLSDTDATVTPNSLIVDITGEQVLIDFFVKV